MKYQSEDEGYTKKDKPKSKKKLKKFKLNVNSERTDIYNKDYLKRRFDN
tara:strand:+ start:10444 stop:10590 length:147 start_codon:yes stop_codon:yes gene_type:complete